LFKDKKSMMDGKVTEFAKKRFNEGDKNVAQYLAQVKAQISEDLKGKEKDASKDKKSAPDAKSLVNTKQTG